MVVFRPVKAYLAVASAFGHLDVWTPGRLDAWTPGRLDESSRLHAIPLSSEGTMPAMELEHVTLLSARLLKYPAVGRYRPL